MKQILTLILTVLLLCGMLVPAALAADETSVTTDTTSNDTVIDTDSGSSTDSYIPDETATPSDAGIVTDSAEPTGADGGSGTPSTTGGSIAPPAVITLNRFDEPYRTDAVAFALGTSQEELSDWFADVYSGFTGYDADGNPYDLVSDAWSLDPVDTDTPGVYYAWAEPALGADYTLAAGVSLPRQLCAVSVQTPGKPDINCCVSGRGFLRFPWVLSAEQQEQLDEFAVWLRQDSGEWTQLSSGFYFTSDDLQLSQRIFEYGSTYELKVTYPGGQTGVLTFQYDGELSIIDYTGGDRDGGDVNGDSSGAGSQPAPAPSQTPSHSHDDDNPSNDDSTPVQNNSSLAPNETSTGSASTSEETQEEPAVLSNEAQEEPDSLSNEAQQEQIPVSNKPVFITLAAPAESALEPSNTSSAYKSDASVAQGTANRKVSQPSESYSPEQTVISGLRLRDLCADEESVVFGSGDLTVSIPSKLLLALNLADSDTLSIKLTQPESNQIMLAAEASGKSVTELSGTVLRLRYMPKSENAEITVWSEMGEQITDAAFDGEVLRFTANTAKTYTILEASKVQDPQKSGVSPLLPVSGGLILTAGGITLFRRKFYG